MRYQANQVEGCTFRCGFGACCGFVACLLIAAMAYGQENTAAAPAKPQGTAQVKASQDTGPVATEKDIWQALQMKCDFEFVNTPLSNVVDSIKNLTKIEIQLDKKAMVDAGLPPDLPVTKSIKGVTIQSVLRLMLKEVGLTYVIRDGMLVITTPEEAESRLSTKVYAVHDLVMTKPMYLFEGMYVPGISTGTSPRAFSAGVTSAGGQIGGLGSGIGIFGTSTPPQSSKPTGASSGRRGPASTCMEYDELIDVIVATVAPSSWDAMGGPGSIQPVAGMLVVAQTEENHQGIEKILAYLRASTPGLQVVTIRATWLLLNYKQLNELLDRKTTEGGILHRDLEELAAKVRGYSGAVTCMNGQTVHIASGHIRSALTGMIPVVGDYAAAYEPVVSTPQSGAVLQVTPQLLPGSQEALLDVCSVLTDYKGATTGTILIPSPTIGKKDSEPKPATNAMLDRVNVVVGQLATTLKMPLGQPTLVGGLTREPSAEGENAANTPQLYLFIEATAK